MGFHRQAGIGIDHVGDAANPCRDHRRTTCHCLDELADRKGRRSDLHELLVRLGSRLSQTTAAERAAVVREFVLSIEVEAERDQSGKPIR